MLKVFVDEACRRLGVNSKTVTSRLWLFGSQKEWTMTDLQAVRQPKLQERVRRKWLQIRDIKAVAPDLGERLDCAPEVFTEDVLR